MNNNNIINTNIDGNEPMRGTKLTREVASTSDGHAIVAGDKLTQVTVGDTYGDNNWQLKEVTVRRVVKTKVWFQGHGKWSHDTKDKLFPLFKDKAKADQYLQGIKKEQAMALGDPINKGRYRDLSTFLYNESVKATDNIEVQLWRLKIELVDWAVLAYVLDDSIQNKDKAASYDEERLEQVKDYAASLCLSLQDKSKKTTEVFEQLVRDLAHRQRQR